MMPTNPDPRERATSSNAETIPSGFGFDLPDDEWLGQLRQARTTPALGRLGEYELLDEVGRGAQGVVYRARQPKTNRQVALKHLVAGTLASASMRARFEREVEAAAALEHPNIVTVYGTEEIDRQPVLTMQWVDGLPVDRWALSGPAGPRPLAQRLRLFTGICDAVQHAHQRGVIHRDLKPTNILVDAADEPHVLDFGLAKVISADDSNAARLTFTQEFVGTPAYASPEQVRFGAASVDARSDVYSLGVILYQLLTGVTPFGGDISLADLLHAIQHEEPARPQALNRSLDREMDVIVMKALAKDPVERYQSVDALGSDVARYVAGEPVTAHPPSMLYQVRKLIRRHRLPMAFAATVFLLLAAFSAVVGTLALRLDRERDRAVAAQEREEAARRAAERTNEFLRSMLASADPAHAQGRDVTVREMLDVAAARIDAEFAEQPEAKAILEHTIGWTYLGLGDYEAAEPHLRRALTLRQSLPAVSAGALAQSEQGLATWHQVRGAYDDAERLFRRAIERLQTDTDVAGDVLAQATNNLAMLLHTRGQYEEAEALYSRALDVAPADAPIEPTILKNLSELARDRGDLDEADRLAGAAYERFSRLLGPRHPETIQAQVGLARLHFAASRFNEAETLLRDALAVEKEVQGPEHPDTLVTEGLLALVVQRLGRLAEAEQIFREVATLQRARRGSDHPETARAVGNLAAVLDAQGRYEEALELGREALAGLDGSLGPNHADTISALHDLASYSQRLGRLAEAETLFRRAAMRFEKTLGPGHAETLNAQNSLATALHDLGRIDDAVDLYRSVIERSAATYGPTHFTTLLTEFNYGTALLDQGDAAAAREQFEHFIAALEPQLPDDHWLFANARSYLGLSLARLGEFETGEALLHAAHDRLYDVFGPEHDRVQKTRARLAELYDLWNRPKEAAAWRGEDR